MRAILRSPTRSLALAAASKRPHPRAISTMRGLIPRHADTLSRFKAASHRRDGSEAQQPKSASWNAAHAAIRCCCEVFEPDRPTRALTRCPMRAAQRRHPQGWGRTLSIARADTASEASRESVRFKGFEAPEYAGLAGADTTAHAESRTLLLPRQTRVLRSEAVASTRSGSGNSLTGRELGKVGR